MEYKKFKKGDPVLIMFRKKPYVGSYVGVDINNKPHVHYVAFPTGDTAADNITLEEFYFRDNEVEHLNLGGN